MSIGLGKHGLKPSGDMSQTNPSLFMLFLPGILLQ